MVFLSKFSFYPLIPFYERILFNIFLFLLISPLIYLKIFPSLDFFTSPPVNVSVSFYF